MNRGGKLILIIAIWKIIKKFKNTLPKNVNSRSYGGRNTLTLGEIKYK